ncbi:hypothetical protein [Streptomyces sp. NBC_00470]|uniref:hypothetical protein n=1 Tax=Streptomyces sp. NBC_00470 TaxID=2975753 RepID=UPI002F910B20
MPNSQKPSEHPAYPEPPSSPLWNRSKERGHRHAASQPLTDEDRKRNFQALADSSAVSPRRRD